MPYFIQLDSGRCVEISPETEQQGAEAIEARVHDPGPTTPAEVTVQATLAILAEHEEES